MNSRSFVFLALLLLAVVNYANCSVFPFTKDRIEPDDEWTEALAGLNLNLDEIIQRSRREWDMWKRTEDSIIGSNVKVKPGTTSYAQYLDGQSSEDVRTVNDVGLLMTKISHHIVRFCKSKAIPELVCANYLATIDLRSNVGLWNQCQNVSDLSGTFRRLLLPDYKDGIFKIRSTRDSQDLPSPRTISKEFFNAALEFRNLINPHNQTSSEGNLDPKKNIFFVQFAQFIEQDLVKTTPQTLKNGNPIQCCDKYFHYVAPRYRHKACSPILIPEDDDFYQKLFVNCLNYVRSSVAPNDNCKLGAPNQINGVSGTFDLSQLYGATSEASERVRLLRDGQLKSTGNFLPRTEVQCLEGNDTCFLSGDVRVNANPFSSMMHLIFLRSHNKIATKLKAINPQWNDQRLFETAKAINLAIFQKLSFEEWMPLVLGQKVAKQILENTDQNSQETRVSNEFATAGIRFYNTMMPGSILNQSVPQLTQKLFDLMDVFYKTEDSADSQHFLLDILTSALKQKAMAMDTSYVDDLNMQLYRAQNGAETEIFGTDSLALDIMRSRDHGLKGYVYYLNACQGHPVDRVQTWRDLEAIIHKQDLRLLRKVYRHSGAVDLIMGALAEIPKPGSIVGPTLACIIGEQMDNSRRSDANFYQKHGNLRRTVENYSGAKLLCDTMEISSVPANIFEIPSTDGRNPIVCCDELSNNLNLDIWRSTAK